MYDARVRSRIDSIRDFAGIEATAQVVDDFLTTTPARLVAIARALDQGDRARASWDAQLLMGDAQLIGADQVADLCGQLVRRGCEGPLRGCGAVLMRLIAAFDRVRGELSAYPVSTGSAGSALHSLQEPA